MHTSLISTLIGKRNKQDLLSNAKCRVHCDVVRTLALSPSVTSNNDKSVSKATPVEGLLKLHVHYLLQTEIAALLKSNYTTENGLLTHHTTQPHFYPIEFANWWGKSTKLTCNSFDNNITSRGT
jgi:hypothetical protein